MSGRNERLQALLMDEATGNLSAEEKRELEELLQQESGVDRYVFERVASAVFLAGAARPAAQMPEDLTKKLIAAGQRLMADGD